MDQKSLMDNFLRSLAVSSLLRVGTGRPVFVQGNLMDAGKFVAANIAYDVVKPAINRPLQAATGLSLPNGQ